MAVLIDNKNRGRIVDTLSAAIKPKAMISILSSNFSIFAYKTLRRQLEKADSIRLLFQKNSLNASSILGGEAERRFRNSLEQSRVAQDCKAWLDQKVDIKVTTMPTPQNLIIVQNEDGGSFAITGSSPFTSVGLGVLPSNGYEMNTLLQEEEELNNLLEWFEGLWNDPGVSSSDNSGLESELQEIARDRSPEELYYTTLFHMFHDSLEEIEEEKIIKSRTGIRDTSIWEMLYKFQRDAVLGAIHKIENYNGCIIADSVGLGKTFEALAVIKYYELRNDRVLVLCPKRLRENWTIYTINDKRNLLASDRFNYDVLNHTDLTRLGGYSGEINLETLNWGNYDLLVIDESHNFRNNPPRKDGLTRYGRLMRDIIRSGVKTKVLMLSATPVNNRMNDLKNQVAFITEGNDDALEELGIASIEQDLKLAQIRFNRWLKQDIQARTTESLLDALNPGYFKILDTLTIARSRKHIAKYYDLSEVGPFPERTKPVNIKTDIDELGEFPSLKKINRDIRMLNLSAYTPLKYVLPDRLEEYGRRYDMQVSGGSVFRQIDREQSLIHLMRVNLFKRMESSINSFTITIEKLLSQVHGLIERIDSHEEQDSVEELSIEEIDTESEEFEPYLIGNKIKVLIQDMDRIRWRQELEEDAHLLEELVRVSAQVDAARDRKLQRLKELIRHKVRAPFNRGNKKVLLFTAFADTAVYLYNNLSSWAQSELGIHIGLVTGGGENRTSLPGVKKDLNAVLTSFSPRSKERDQLYPGLVGEIDLLIATDCISEGQNLQDCDFMVNYDIHWNPVRIIQRFGRIDRLGSRNSSVQLVNFWPNMELDEYIDLEARVSGRMVLLDISATGEENIIEVSSSEEMRDLEYRRRQLEQLQQEIVDIEELQNGISITDMTLNDFRMDLSDYLKRYNKPARLPFTGQYAVSSDAVGLSGYPGVIFCLKDSSDTAGVSHDDPLSPLYLVFVTENGEVKLNYTQSRKVLDLLKKIAVGKSDVDESGVKRFREKTRGETDMSFYQDLLQHAFAGITGKVEEKGVESLFAPGGTAFGSNSFPGIEDFEVVSYLVMVEE
jgi:ERCC4-related helicase